MNKPGIFLITMVLSWFAHAELTVHINNPWIENPYRQDSVFISGIGEVGYHPGTKMTAEGNGWFYYTIEEDFFSNATITFKSYIGNQYVDYGQRVDFPDSSSNGIMLNDDLLDQFPGYTEFWIIPVDSLSTYNVYVEPPEGKVIHIMNPWPNNSPQIVVGENPARKMRVNTQQCGWYTYFFSGFIDSLQNVRFTDYYHTEQYGSNGLNVGSPINLADHLAEEDTVYVLPRPFPSGAPSVTHSFPGKTGECPTRQVSALVRDWKADDVSFFVSGKNGGKVTPGMVEGRLGEDGKPNRGPNAADADGTELETWFVTEDNNETCVDLTLTKGYDGLWEYDSDLFGGFFPIDDFDHPNNIKYEDSNERKRNFHFTMEMHLQFKYHQGSGQEFVFRGDDDVWIFVNNLLAIDLGGFHMPAADTLIMDDLAHDLGLEDGGNYAMDIFFAERQPTNSNFLVRTSLDLRNSADLFYVDRLLGPGKTEYDIMQIVGTEGLDCGFTPLMSEEELAVVNFYLEGPQFSEQQGPLAEGLHYEGILVSASSVTIDSASIEDLKPGEYVLTFASKYDQDRQGYLTFEVGGKLSPIVSIHPPGREFIDPLTVTVEVNDPEATIYYTTDGTIPTENGQRYEGPLQFSRTTRLMARAFTPEADPSDVVEEIYTRNISGMRGAYYDSNGDGAIDSVTVTLDIQADRVPDSLILTNPFNESERRIVLADRITLSPDSMSLKAAMPHAFSFSGNTGFRAQDLARFGGYGYSHESFGVDDRVAPILTRVIFKPRLFGDEDSITDIGTLSVTFSENIASLKQTESFSFDHNGTTYSLDLSLTSRSGREAIYSVDNVIGIEFADNGDMVRIAPAQAVTDLSANIQNNPRNSAIPMEMRPPEYSILFKNGPNPFIPDVSQVDPVEGLTITSGTSIVADFRGNLRNLAEKVDGKVAIFDGTSNKLCEATLGDDTDAPVQCALVRGKRTKVVIHWTGYTQRGRKVGMGTYVAVVTITDPSGNTISRKIPIGVTYEQN